MKGVREHNPVNPEKNPQRSTEKWPPTSPHPKAGDEANEDEHHVTRHQFPDSTVPKLLKTSLDDACGGTDAKNAAGGIFIPLSWTGSLGGVGGVGGRPTHSDLGQPFLSPPTPPPSPVPPRGKREDEEDRSVAPVYFRRLSQSTEKELLVGALEESGKVSLRPYSVRKRIQELNLRAFEFGETILALQGFPVRFHKVPQNASSVQCSPWASPKLLSPVDVRQLAISRSMEDIYLRTPIPSPVRSRRRSRNSESKGSEQHQHDSEQLLSTNGARLESLLKSVSTFSRVLSQGEVKGLTSFLYTKDEKLLQRILITISNCSAFSMNQAASQDWRVSCTIILDM
ncbi:unnamed protein product [Darwinula stevensoni]|uniref:Uncharacterized protein n=1 Tax=Darwinula stevensoni TaxID=69355 RepID=A0A7R8X906_9CRUS|nr:unnamed protein product [Darwinula stevensoni]CAG0888659.1 unnamed protein product [Darwinula stevensoni]